MSYWQDYSFEEKIKNILKEAAHVGKASDISGKPFMSVYQIALEFNRLFAEDVKNMGYEVSSAVVPGNKSLPQYIAMQLSRRIKKGEIKGIEEVMLSHLYGDKLLLKQGEESYEVQLTEAKTNRLLYRYKEQ